MFYSLRLDNIFHSASVPYPHGSLLLMLTPPLQKNKKNFGEWRRSLTGCPYGGCLACVDGCAPLEPHAPAHRHNTPPTVRCTGTKINAACAASVCEQNVRLLANRKRAYLIISVAYNIYNILVRNGIYKIYNVCHSPHVRRLGRLKNARPPRIYTANTPHAAATLPRCSAYR